MRLAYLGTPRAAVPTLQALHRAGHEIVLVVSGADKRRGRGRATSPSPVKVAATDLGLPVTDRLDDVVDVPADLGVVVAYGRIIGPHILARRPMVNVHFSLLPRWRGAAPVERAILAGDERAGVCVMDVEEGLDTGAVHARAEVPLDDVVTADELRGRLADLGSELLVDTLAAGLGPGEPQPDVGVTYARKLRPDEFELHWDRPAVELHRIVRVGGAWTTFRGSRLKVLAVDRPHAVPAAPPGGPGTLAGPAVLCGDGSLLRLVTVQPGGRAPMDAASWANGARLEPIDRLGS